MLALLGRPAVPPPPKADMGSAFPTCSPPENVGMRDGCCCCCGARGTGLLPLQVLLEPPPVLEKANRPDFAALASALDFDNTAEKSGSC